ncbi:MAG TPA: DbpA RNA binding domain-containing protein, partial [Spirochaetia bacterium]|nr:DbpA RNA binding domain-containing protein [Spirochaetia bacterium]
AGTGAAEAARTPRGRFGRSIESTSPSGSRMGRSMETQTGADRQGRQSESQRPSKAGAAGEGQFTQLFISIGRNRRVYARDLTELFTEKLQLQAGDIGGVRVFEKYSFVDIVPGKAGDAIALLSGSELKGRTITVNYAKKKEEKEEK